MGIFQMTAHAHASRIFVIGIVERFAFARTKKIMTNVPMQKPEKSFRSFLYPADELAAYEHSWKEHFRRFTTSSNSLLICPTKNKSGMNTKSENSQKTTDARRIRIRARR